MAADAQAAAAAAAVVVVVVAVVVMVAELTGREARKRSTRAQGSKPRRTRSP